jgi:hypothetical protein
LFKAKISAWTSFYSVAVFRYEMKPISSKVVEWLLLIEAFGGINFFKNSKASFLLVKW